MHAHKWREHVARGHGGVNIRAPARLASAMHANHPWSRRAHCALNVYASEIWVTVELELLWRWRKRSHNEPGGATNRTPGQRKCWHPGEAGHSERPEWPTHQLLPDARRNYIFHYPRRFVFYLRALVGSEDVHLVCACYWALWTD